jgi:O-6-methylguanine DNA methyltransferase
MRHLQWSSHSTKLGTVYVASTEKGICKIAIPAESKRDFMAWLERTADGGTITENSRRHRRFVEELNRYLSQRLVKFTTRLDPIGTGFQKRVWRELRKVRYGTTITYKDLAHRVGRVGAFQSVGRANGANPLPIVIPCHRIVGSDRRLVGYAAGIKTKEFLLRLEGALLI